MLNWSDKRSVCRKFYLVFLIFIVGHTSEKLYAQLPAFYTQYLSNELVVNPAYAGADDALSISLLHRSQWINIEGMPVTQTLSGHSLIKSKNVGIGGILSHDQIGVHRNLLFLSVYSYRINLDKERYLSMGIQAGISNRRSDYAGLSGQVNNPQDPKLLINSSSINFFEFGAGIFYLGPRLKIGISAPKMLVNNKVFNDSVRLEFNTPFFFSNASYRIPLSKNVDLLPGILIKYMSDIPVSYDLNLQTEINEALMLGFSYRVNSSLNFILQTRITPQLRVGYAYDHPIGELAIFNQGAHEIMIQYLFSFLKPNVKKPR